MIVTVDSKWLLSHLDDPNLIIIDARGSIPYSIEHIKNALSLAVERVISVASNGANLVIDAPIAEEVFSSLGIDDNKIVVVYGEHINPSAARIAWTLMYHGHPNVKLLDVGLDQWQKYGLPVTRQISNQNKQLNKNVHFKSKINSLIRADADMIKAKQQQNHSSAVIVDARTPIEHMQARIPGSILDNWEEGLGPNDETMKSKEELEMDFEDKKQIGKDREIICYCHSGARASHKYLQFKQAGYNNVKVYDGSIIDWAQRHNPIR